MKVSREKAAANRAHIVQSASRLFTEEGIDGVGVAELTAAAGLTHGGFYRQFESKEALAAEACTAAIEAIGETLEKALTKKNGFQDFVKYYLSEGHYGDKGGCPVVCLGADVPRQGEEVQAAFTDGLKKFLEKRGYKTGTREWMEHTAAFATLVGAVVMAKAVYSQDKVLAGAIVKAAAEKLSGPNVKNHHSR